MAEWKRDVAEEASAHEHRERLESSERPIRKSLLRERQPDGTSSYRMAPRNQEEHVDVPTIVPPAQPRRESGPTLKPFEPTTDKRSPREQRDRRTPARRRVSQSLAAAEAAAQRVIERAAAAQALPTTTATATTHVTGPLGTRAPRDRAETIAGLGTMLPPQPADDDDEA